MDAKLRSEAFYLAIGDGQRFCVYHPAKGNVVRGAILYIHPFAEEMNKSRRMAGLQARALAQLGYSVLQLDLLGCGDSSGDFGDATSTSWRADIAAAWDWLEANSSQKIILWGLRLGATMALDFAYSNSRWPAKFLLWQPVLNGAVYMTQILRLRVASEMMDGGNVGGVRALRESLQQGNALEVAGYAINPELANYIDTLRVNKLIPAKSPVIWMDVSTAARPSATPAAEEVMNAWRAGGATFEFETLVGPTFWATQEITDCPALLERTTNQFLSFNK